MGIEQLVQRSLVSFRWLDDRIQREYTQHGQQLSNNLLYPVTFGLCTIGLYVGAAPLVATLGATTQLDPRAIAAPFGFFAFDFYYNILGVTYTIAGYPEAINPTIKEDKNPDSAYSADSPAYQKLPIISICQLMNKVIRLPTLFLSSALIGKGLYDKGASFLGRTSSDLSSDHYIFITAGLGFLAVCSSMYLKEKNQ